MRALVVFNSDCAHWAAGFLDRRFRHVFCVIEDPRVEDGWIEANLTRSDGLVMRAVGGSYFDLIVAYGENAEVVPIEAEPGRRRLTPFALNSCVGYTKALLGIRSRAATPAQLYRYLTKEPEMRSLELNMTLPGLTPSIPAAPPPPAPPPPPPTQVDARRQLGIRGANAGRATPENVRNVGGAGGIPTNTTNMGGMGFMARAMKGLTGQ